MSHLSRTVFSAAAALLLATTPVLAQFDDGVAALRGGDYGKALEAWQKGADAGDARSQYSLGYLYQFGLGVDADSAKAREWYEKSAAANNPDALYALGLLYERGRSVERNLTTALQYYQKAADTGQAPDAEYALGRLYLRGRGVARDPATAIGWLNKAASHHQAAAEYMLGVAYEAGWGVTPNASEAYYWYRRAAAADTAELEEQDMAFEPKIAIEALTKRLTPAQIAGIEARLRKDADPTAGPSSMANVKPDSTVKLVERSRFRPSELPKDDGLPKDALTAPK